MNGYNLHHKIQYLRNEDDESTKFQKDITEIELADLMYKINAKYPNDIEDHTGARNIIDLQFEFTSKFFYVSLFCYLFGFVIPFSF